MSKQINLRSPYLSSCFYVKDPYILSYRIMPIVYECEGLEVVDCE